MNSTMTCPGNIIAGLLGEVLRHVLEMAVPTLQAMSHSAMGHVPNIQSMSQKRHVLENGCPNTSGHVPFSYGTCPKHSIHVTKKTCPRERLSQHFRSCPIQLWDMSHPCHKKTCPRERLFQHFRSCPIQLWDMSHPCHKKTCPRERLSQHFRPCPIQLWDFNPHHKMLTQSIHVLYSTIQHITKLRATPHRAVRHVKPHPLQLSQCMYTCCILLHLCMVSRREYCKLANSDVI